MDALTFETWRADFCVLMARDGVDLTLLISDGSYKFDSPETARLWRLYRDGRMHERNANAQAMPSLISLSVIDSTDWQAVNAIARGLG